MKKPNTKKKVQKTSKKSVIKQAKVKSAVQKSAVGVSPVGDKVLVRPLSAAEMGTTTSFGLILPDSAKDKPEQGEVVAVGPGKKGDHGERVALDVSVGDRVYFKKPWDEPIKINGVEYYIISESDITLIVE